MASRTASDFAMLPGSLGDRSGSGRTLDTSPDRDAGGIDSRARGAAGPGEAAAPSTTPQLRYVPSLGGQAGFFARPGAGGRDTVPLSARSDRSVGSSRSGFGATARSTPRNSRYTGTLSRNPGASRRNVKSLGTKPSRKDMRRTVLSMEQEVLDILGGDRSSSWAQLVSQNSAVSLSRAATPRSAVSRARAPSSASGYAASRDDDGSILSEAQSIPLVQRGSTMRLIDSMVGHVDDDDASQTGARAAGVGNGTRPRVDSAESGATEATVDGDGDGSDAGGGGAIPAHEAGASDSKEGVRGGSDSAEAGAAHSAKVVVLPRTSTEHSVTVGGPPGPGAGGTDAATALPTSSPALTHTSSQHSVKDAEAAAEADEAARRPTAGCGERLAYAVDKCLSKRGGTTRGLAVFAVLLVALCGLLIFIGRVAIGEAAVFTDSLWQSWTYIADPGTHADESEWVGRTTSLLTTLSGIMFFAMVVGFVVDGIRERMEMLKKGRSKVIANDHYLLLNFADGKSFALIAELCLAMESEGGGTIVVLSDRDKIELESELHEHFSSRSLLGTEVVVRSGSTMLASELMKVSAYSARSITVMAQPGDADKSDAEVLRTVLAIMGLRTPVQGHVVAEVRDIDNESLLEVVSRGSGQGGRGALETIVSHDIIGRLMVNCARHPGLADCYELLLGYAGDEFYAEEWPELEGVPFGDLFLRFPDAVPLGIIKGANVVLNPPSDTRLEKGDRLLVLAEDDDTYQPEPPATDVKMGALPSNAPQKTFPERILMCGWRRDVDDVLELLDSRALPGSHLHMLCELSVEERRKRLLNNGMLEGDLENLHITHFVGNPSFRRDLEPLPVEIYDSVIVMADEKHEVDPMSSDSQALACLLLMRHLQEGRGIRFSVPGAPAPDVIIPTLREGPGSRRVRDSGGAGSVRQRRGSRGADIVAAAMPPRVQVSLPPQFTEVPRSSSGRTFRLSKRTSRLRNKLSVRSMHASGFVPAESRDSVNTWDTIPEGRTAAPSTAGAGGDGGGGIAAGAGGGAALPASPLDAAPRRWSRGSAGSAGSAGGDDGRPPRPSDGAGGVHVAPPTHVVHGRGGPGEGSSSMSEKRRQRELMKHGVDDSRVAAQDILLKRQLQPTTMICELLDARTRAVIMSRNSTIAGLSDFILSNSIIARVLAMVAERREVKQVLNELLGPDGNEVALYSASKYVQPGQEASFWEVSMRARSLGHIALGYKRSSLDVIDTVHAIQMNPRDKRAPILWHAADEVIVMTGMEDSDDVQQANRMSASDDDATDGAADAAANGGGGTEGSSSGTAAGVPRARSSRTAPPASAAGGVNDVASTGYSPAHTAASEPTPTHANLSKKQQRILRRGGGDGAVSPMHRHETVSPGATHVSTASPAAIHATTVSPGAASDDGGGDGDGDASSAAVDAAAIPAPGGRRAHELEPLHDAPHADLHGE